MERVFLKIVNLSLTAGIMVLAVIALRLILKKAPKWMFCLLWGLVAIRLVFPFTIETPFSLLPESFVSDSLLDDAAIITGDVMPVERGAETGAINNPNEYLEIPDNMHEAVDITDAKALTSDGQTIVRNEQSSDNNEASINNTLNSSMNNVASGYAPVSSDVKPVIVLSYIWLAGMAAMLVYAVVSAMLLKRRLRTATRFQKGIKQSEQVASPFVLGIIRPVIYLPYQVKAEDLPHIVAHERAHIKRKDHWWKPLGFLLLSVYWFNPLLWVAYIFLCRDIEAACDEKVVKELDRDSVRAYSTALLNCSVQHRRIAACPIAFGEESVKGRVKNVMNYKKPAFWIVGITVLALIVVGVMFLTTKQNNVSAESGTEDKSVEEIKDGSDLQAADRKTEERPVEGLLQNASPDTSALQLSYFDGEKTYLKYIFNPEEEKEIINEINSLELKKVDSSRVSEMKVPCYGMTISDKEGFDIWLTYSGGMWLTKDVSVYEGSYDFGSIYASAGDDSLNVLEGGIFMPNAAILGCYDSRFYSRAEAMAAEKDGVSISVKSYDEDTNTITLLITNNSDKEFCYGDAFELQKEIEGVWYILPARLSNYAFTDILHVLPSGQSVEEKCDLTMYGNLRDFIGGNYRIEKEKLATEFNVIPIEKIYIDEIPGIQKRTMTLSDVLKLSDRGEKLAWSDFDEFTGTDVGSGLYIMQYKIDGNFEMLVGGGSPDEELMYARLVHRNTEERTDIRTGDKYDILSFVREALEEEAGLYTRNSDGTYTGNNGVTYRYRLELPGKMPDEETEYGFIVLSDDATLDYDKFAKFLISSSVDPNEHLLVSSGKILSRDEVNNFNQVYLEAAYLPLLLRPEASEVTRVYVKSRPGEKEYTLEGEKGRIMS